MNNKQSTILEMVELNEAGLFTISLAISGLIKLLIWGVKSYSGLKNKKKSNNQLFQSLKKDNEKVFKDIIKLFEEIDNVDKLIKKHKIENIDKFNHKKRKDILLKLKDKITNIKDMGYDINDELNDMDIKYNDIMVDKISPIINWSKKVIKSIDKSLKKRND